MRSKGYTFIEIMIALAVAVIISSVGITRYNAYIGRQTFVSESGQLVACLQKGQQDAESGFQLPSTAPALYTMVTIEPDPSGLRCTIEAIGAENSPTTALLLPLATLGAGSAGYDDTEVDSTIAKNLSLNLVIGSEFRIIFSVLQHGLPADYTTNGISMKPSTAQSGFSSSFSVEDVSANTIGTITIGETGAPVRIQGGTDITP